jgi:rhamnosyltransferase
MKIAATVILYYPTEKAINNVQSYINGVEKLFIIDNSETVSSQVAEFFSQSEKVIYLHDGENKGIAKRLNQVCKLAKEARYDWLLTMDQDSFFAEGIISNYLHCVNRFDQKEKISMFGINFSEKTNNPDECNAVSVKHLITSGSILNLKLMETTGGFDENLFIDEVDFEYCLRSVAHGFNIIEFTNIFLNHNLGETSWHRSFKTSKITSRVLHSPFRIYYMTRNFLYVQSKYKNLFPAEIALRKTILLNRLKNNILYNKHRFKVIKYILKGVKDYRRKRMGKMK